MSSRISGGQQRCDWYIIPDVPTTLALLTADGSDWSSPPRVLVGPLGSDGIIDLVVPEITATIDGVDGSLARATLDDTAMDAILAAYPLTSHKALPWHVRLANGESETAVSTGYLVWDLTGRQASTATVVVGAPGPAGVAGFVESQTPAAPAVGESVTYWVTAGVTWPAGVEWDSGGAPTVTGGMLVVLFTAADGIVRGTYGVGFNIAATTTTTTVSGTTTTTTTEAPTTTTTTTAAPTTTTTTTAPTIPAMASVQSTTALVDSTHAAPGISPALTDLQVNWTTPSYTAGQIGWWTITPRSTITGGDVQVRSLNGTLSLAGVAVGASQDLVGGQWSLIIKDTAATLYTPNGTTYTATVSSTARNSFTIGLTGGNVSASFTDFIIGVPT